MPTGSMGCKKRYSVIGVRCIDITGQARYGKRVRLLPNLKGVRRLRVQYMALFMCQDFVYLRKNHELTIVIRVAELRP